jgi:CheY-like chemotaxis protein
MPRYAAKPTCSPAPEAIVLVVEDEPSLLVLIRRMLDHLKIGTRPSDSAENAITIAQSPDLQMDALLTDLQLPEMSGLELARQVRALRPGLPVVFMSGYPRESAFGPSPTEFRDAEFIQKPFTPHQLGVVMRRVLTSRTPPPDDDTTEVT